MFFIYFRGLCTDSIRKSPTHNSTRPSQGLPVKPQWTSCAQFGHSLPGPSGHFALGLSSRTDQNLHGKLAGSMAHMWPESPAAGRKKHVAGKPFSYSAEQTRSSHIKKCLKPLRPPTMFPDCVFTHRYDQNAVELGVCRDSM